MENSAKQSTTDEQCTVDSHHNHNDETVQGIDNDTDLVIVEVSTKQEIDTNDTEVTDVAVLFEHKEESNENDLNDKTQDLSVSTGNHLASVHQNAEDDTEQQTVYSHNKDEEHPLYPSYQSLTKEHEIDNDKVSVSGDTVNDNDSKEIELVIDKTDKDELDDNTKSYFEQFIANFGKYLYVLLLITTISLIGVLIGFNEPDAESGIIIGLVWFVMILSGILTPLITVFLLKIWTKSTWFFVFFLIYVSLIIDVFAIGTYMKEIQTPLIIYGIVKILLIYHSYQFARIDGKFFVSSIISEYISIKFLKKKTELYQLIYLYIAVLFIQCIVVSLGCMAFVIDNIVSIAVYIVALVLFIWLNNTFRHFVTYIQCRWLAYNVSTESVNNILVQNPEFNPLKQSFHDALDKFTTIVIGSLLITTTPITYGITNLMQGIRILTTGLVLCCAPCADEDDDGNARCCCIPQLIVIASALANIIALIVRKVSKWSLRVTAKTILIQSGFQNITFWKAIKEQNKKVYKESKETFGSDMLFLDNCMLSTVTHLCILVSSIGALLAYMIQPNAAIICWIAGYISCRTMVEMIDVLLQFFLIAWFVEPRIIYDNKVLFSQLKLRIIETLRTLYPNESDEFIKQQILELSLEMDTVTGVQKTTDTTNITNLKHTKEQCNAAQQTNVVVNSDCVILSVHQNKAIQVNTETNNMENGRSKSITNSVI